MTACDYHGIQPLFFSPVYQDNLFVWDLELSDFEKGSALQSDLENYARIYNQKVRDLVLD